MAFPSSPLDLRTELLAGSTIIGISSYVYNRDSVVITRGRANEAATTERSTSRMSLDNRTGRFSPRNPIGAYYGQIGRNTAIRQSLPGDGTTYCRVPGRYGLDNATCPDAAGLHITGDIDIRIDVTLDNVLQYQTLATKGDWGTFGGGGTASNLGWIFYLNASGQLKLRWSTNGTSSNGSAAATVNLSASQSGTQLALRATLAVASGTVTFYTAPNISGSWTQLGSTVVAGATSIFASTSQIQVGEAGNNAVSLNASIMAGRVNAFQLLSGIGGTAKANPVFNTQTIGTTSFTDAAGNTWTLNGQMEVTNRWYRFHGEVSSWPPKWDVSGKDVWAPIEAAGLLRRYGQGSAPVTSPIKRAVTVSKTTPIVYWPCEDASGSTSFAVAAGSGQPMTISGSPTLAADSHIGGAAPLPTIGSSTWTGTIPPYTSSSPNAASVCFVVYLNSAPANGAVIMRVITASTRFDFAWSTSLGGGFYINAYDLTTGSIATGGLDNSTTPQAASTGTPYAIEMQFNQSGSAVNYGWSYSSTGSSSTGIGYGLLTSRTLGQMSQVQVDPTANLTDTVVGHISANASQPLPWPQMTSLTGNAGETAGARFIRLCLENGVQPRTFGDPFDSPQMGAQGSDTFLNLLRSCISADGGMLVEPRDVLGLGIRMRSSLMSQASAATLSHNGGHLAPPLEPVDDDQLVRNDVTVTRTNGSSVRATLDAGTLSTQDPPNGVGRYPSTPNLILYQDSQLANEATWRLHETTIDESRYPAIRVDQASPGMVANPTLALQVQALDIGQVLTLTGLPSWLPPSDTRQLIQGITEEMGVKQWKLTFNCSPASPYDVLVFDDTVFGKVDTDGSTLNDVGGLNTTATTFTVATTNAASPPWTTSSADWPFDVTMDGEQMTVTNVSGATSPQTLTVTRSVNGVVKSHSFGAAISLQRPMYFAL